MRRRVELPMESLLKNMIGLFSLADQCLSFGSIGSERLLQQNMLSGFPRSEMALGAHQGGLPFSAFDAHS
jgi:hypothetical protein